MSLRRRIAAAAAVSVAAVALLVAGIGYFSARSHLIGNVRQQLETLAGRYLQEPRTGNQGVYGTGLVPPSADYPHPQAPALGGAPGYFQFVYPSGSVHGVSGTTKLPVSARVLAIAKSGKGSFFTDATVDRTHLEVYTIADTNSFRQGAVEVALPLSSVDGVTHSLLLTYLIVGGAGILLAGLIGAGVGRVALRPIARFSEQTEQITSSRDSSRRLEERGASELRRLASSFNQTLDALERSVQAQRHLIADASHELRTPIAALRSNIQVFLEAERLPVTEREELQESIVAELDELTQLVADVLDLARGVSPRDHVDGVELDTLVREAIGRAQRRAPALKFESDLEQTVIENVPDRVARAVANVIDNASKWSPPDGVVEVSLRAGVLRVRDHGQGFREADLPHVFERFYRADDARRLPGSGLGLAIVRQAAEAYGGSAHAENAPDGGAVVEVTFKSAATNGNAQNP